MEITRSSIDTAKGPGDWFTADDDMDAATRADMQQWTGCIAGALTAAEFRDALAAAGLVDIEIRPTHRVHAHAGSAIIRARAPR
jgi:arsenite methyltransferase